jgi:hypothetical protein
VKLHIGPSQTQRNFTSYLAGGGTKYCFSMTETQWRARILSMIIRDKIYPTLGRSCSSGERLKGESNNNIMTK